MSKGAGCRDFNGPPVGRCHAALPLQRNGHIGLTFDLTEHFCRIWVVTAEAALHLDYGNIAGAKVACRLCCVQNCSRTCPACPSARFSFTISMALTARLLARHFATAFTSQSLPAISYCASFHSSTPSCEPPDDASGSSPAGADHKPSAPGTQSRGDGAQRQQSAPAREQAQRSESQAGTAQANADSRSAVNRQAGSRAGFERLSQGGQQRSKGSYYPSQRQTGQAQQRVNPQPAGNPSFPRRQPDRPHSAPTPFRTAPNMFAPPQGHQTHFRSPGPQQSMPRQGPQFQQTGQPGPHQRAQFPPFRPNYNNQGPQQGFPPSADQQNRFRPRTDARPSNFPPSRDQQDRAAPRFAAPPQDFESHPDDVEANEAEQPRRRKGVVAGRRITPGPARREGNRPGASLRCAPTMI